MKQFCFQFKTIPNHGHHLFWFYMFNQADASRRTTSSTAGGADRVWVQQIGLWKKFLRVNGGWDSLHQSVRGLRMTERIRAILNCVIGAKIEERLTSPMYSSTHSAPQIQKVAWFIWLCLVLVMVLSVICHMSYHIIVIVIVIPTL